jgi:hypothetical protein
MSDGRKRRKRIETACRRLHREHPEWNREKIAMEAIREANRLGLV